MREIRGLRESESKTKKTVKTFKSQQLLVVAFLAFIFDKMIFPFSVFRLQFFTSRTIARALESIREEEE
jgi:hypothetical protein